MNRIVVIGAGGHGQVVGEIIMRMRDCGHPVEPIGFLDDSPALAGQSLLGLPILGPVNKLGEIAHDAVVLGIGDNRRRAAIFETLKSNGTRFFTAIHPSAVVSPTVTIGAGSVVCAGAILCVFASVGENAIINTRASLDHHGTMGSHTHLSVGASTGGNVAIGTGTFVGMGATICPGCRIGDWSFIGAATFVWRNVPDRTKVMAVNDLKPNRPA